MLVDSVEMLVFELKRDSGVTSASLKESLGKGILLKNVSADKTISYGLVE